MPSKIGNALPLLLNLIIQERQVGSLFTSGHLHNFFLLTQESYCEVGIVIAIN